MTSTGAAEGQPRGELDDRVRILIIEDDWIVAQGLREMLRADDFEVVGIVARADRVRALLKDRRPNLALVDIHLGREGDGIAIARDVLAPEGVPFLFASAHADEATLARAREAGAAGFVVKPFTQKQLRAAIEIALGAASRPSAAPSDAAMQELESARKALARLAEALGVADAGADISVRLKHTAALEALSEREREVLFGLLAHRRVSSIAQHLGISAHTVRNHLKAIFAKLGVGSQQELLDLVIDRAAPPPVTGEHDDARASALGARKPTR